MTDHQHEYTVPVEYEYMGRLSDGSLIFLDNTTTYRPNYRRVTKLRCNKCDSEVSRA